MSWSNLAKFLLGFVLAIALLFGGGVAAALYFMSKASTRPPKPVFANDKTIVKTQRSSTAPKAKPTPETEDVASPAPSEAPSPRPQLEPGTYEARVNWPQGLSLRSEPGLDSERIGGVEYNQIVVVLEESADQGWQRVRLNNEQEGWIKAGNIDRLER